MKANTPDIIPRLIMAFKLTGNKRYLNHALTWIDTYIAFENWGDNQDLVASHALFAMSVAYDWLYDELGSSRSLLLKVKITKHANLLYQLLTNKTIWWATDYLQNHNYYNVMSLAVAGVSLHGETPLADSWITAANKNMANVANQLSPDGASHEGIGYWAGGTEALLCHYFAVRRITPEFSLLESDFLRNTWKFRLYMSLPGYRENANFADSHTFEWNGPGSFLRALASLYKNPHAQWLAEAVEQARAKGPQTWLTSPKFSWLDLIWHDSAVDMDPPDKFDNYAFFENLGLYVFRTDWSDSATWFMYKAAPPQGWSAYNKKIVTWSHIHPDQGQILLFSGGKWLLRDDSYTYLKQSKNHNVILVNKAGQLGEGGKWFGGGVELNRRASAVVVKKQFSANFQYLVTDNTALYPQSAGLKRWYRHIVTLKGDTILIVDTIELEEIGEVETFFHLDPTAYASSVGQVCLNGASKQFVLQQILPESNRTDFTNYSIDRSVQQDPDHGIYDGKLFTIQNSNILSTTNVYLITNQNCKKYSNDFFQWIEKGKILLIESDGITYKIDLHNMSAAQSPILNTINKLQ
jgi:hypothetical protein